MTEGQWKAFCSYRESLKDYCSKWSALSGELYPLQKDACRDDTPEYSLENSLVYNTSYDQITIEDEIHYIVIGDNPGKDEQLNKNLKYLVGQSGKIASSFFKSNTMLNTDFRKNVIISNKTPVHTAKTKHIRYLNRNGSDKVRALILESQIVMAELTGELHRNLIDSRDGDDNIPELWLVGYSELKDKGIFVPYREALKDSYIKDNILSPYWDKVKVYQHFSMNRFSIDLKAFACKDENKGNDIRENLELLGNLHRKEIFGI